MQVPVVRGGDARGLHRAGLLPVRAGQHAEPSARQGPLAVGRRCVGRLRSRRRTLLHNKRVRDVAATSAAAAGEKKAIAKPEEELEAADIVANDDDTASAAAATAGAGAPTDEDLAWLEEMYQMGHWGFGRVSISGKTP